MRSHDKNMKQRDPVVNETEIEFKQLASLGDQQYPSFELRHIFRVLSERGQSDWCHQVSDELELPDLDSNEFVASHQALAGLNKVIDAHFSVGLGLDVAKGYQLSDFGDLGIALQHSASLYDALDIALGYYELIGSFTDLTILKNENTFSIRLVNVAGLNDELLHLLFELTISGMVAIGKKIADRTIDTEAIRFRRSLSETEKQNIETQFGCRVEDNCDFDEWVVSMRSLQQPIQRPELSNEQLDQSIEALNELMQGLKNEFALVDRFDQLVRKNEDVFPNSKEIADALHMSERTFRRKLSKIGVNYNLLMSKIRCQLAIAMLQRGGHTNEDIAFELGFSDAANFCNAFKKWTGQTPNFYRL